MKKTQKQKIEKELYKYLDKIFDDLWGGELSFDEIINEIFIKVILEMKFTSLGLRLKLLYCSTISGS